MMYRLEKSNTPAIPIIGKSSSIPAKDALCVSVSAFLQFLSINRIIFKIPIQFD